MDKNLELIYQEIKDRLKDQISEIDQVTIKFNIMLGFNSIIVALMLQAHFNYSLEIFLKPSVLLLFVSITLDLMGLIIRKYRRDPDPWNLFKEYKGKSYNKTRDILIQNYISSFNYNYDKLHNLNKLFTASVIITAVALLFIVTYFIRSELGLIWQKIIIK